ncbi:hypothetical protein IAR55_006593 [Kwoniella newhampshirensis]|uniref:RRM domain-containing protein n=1 Tax=Kwoniella newhampshirensis TaxID=1651941 RepID=A0AAW0YUG6_9TREE
MSMPFSALLIDPTSFPHALARAIRIRKGLEQPPVEGGFYPRPIPCTTHFFNTTIFVGGMKPDVRVEEVRELALVFGDIAGINFLEKGRGSIAFITFKTKVEAESAMIGLQALRLRGSTLRLNWSRDDANPVITLHDVLRWYRGQELLARTCPPSPPVHSATVPRDKAYYKLV